MVYTNDHGFVTSTTKTRTRYYILYATKYSAVLPFSSAPSVPVRRSLFIVHTCRHKQNLTKCFASGDLSDFVRFQYYCDYHALTVHCGETADFPTTVLIDHRTDRRRTGLLRFTNMEPIRRDFETTVLRFVGSPDLWAPLPLFRPPSPPPPPPSIQHSYNPAPPGCYTGGCNRHFVLSF